MRNLNYLGYLSCFFYYTYDLVTLVYTKFAINLVIFSKLISPTLKNVFQYFFRYKKIL